MLKSEDGNKEKGWKKEWGKIGLSKVKVDKKIEDLKEIDWDVVKDVKRGDLEGWMKRMESGVENEMEKMMRGRIRLSCWNDFWDKRMENMRNRIMGGKIEGYVERNEDVGINKLKRKMKRKVIGKKKEEIKGCWKCGIKEDELEEIEDIMEVEMLKEENEIKMKDKKKMLMRIEENVVKEKDDKIEIVWKMGELNEEEVDEKGREKKVIENLKSMWIEIEKKGEKVDWKMIVGDGYKWVR